MCYSPNREAVRDATHYHTRLGKRKNEKNVILSLLYTFFNRILVLKDKEALCCHVLIGMKPAASYWSTINRIVRR